MMKIGFICSEYPILTPHHGGIGTVTQTLARELVRQGHQARVYAAGGQAIAGEDEGVQIFVAKFRGVLRTLWAMRRRLKADLDAGWVEVIESPESEAHYLPGGPGSMVRMHGSHHFWCATLPQKRRWRRLLLEQIGIRQAAGLCAVSRYAAEVTRRAMRLGSRPVEILYNPVNTALFQPCPEEVKPGRVVFAGSIVEKKGIRELCQSMPYVLAQFPAAELHVAGRDQPAPDGSPSFRRQLEATLASATRERIQFLGPLPLAEVSRLMASAAVCAFPSYMETQGIVIAEAMACGRPVVVTERGPGPEMLGEEGECGWLVNPQEPQSIAEKICRILSDGEQANHMGHRGRERAEHLFSVAACLEKNLEFYGRSRSGG
jgi:glycosyltransferase involved in cell wall biosynthesis